MDWGKDKLATRNAGQKAMAAFADSVPTMVGGAADLSESTKTEFPGGDAQRYTRAKAGRNVFFGVREHGMGGAVNGMAAHGGIVRPYGSTFLQFADYMRGVGAPVGADRPAGRVGLHARLRGAGRGRTDAPARRAPHGAARDPRARRAAPRRRERDGGGLAHDAARRRRAPWPSRSHARTCPSSPTPTPTGVARGAYVLRDADDPQVVLVGTGAEVHTALGAADLLAGDGVRARVVSMPSWELFEAQDEAYRDEVLLPALPSVSVEAGISLGWDRWVDRSVAIDRFGASAPGTEVLERLGITPEHVADVVREVLAVGQEA